MLSDNLCLFFLVWCEGGGAPTMRHSDYATASREAKWRAQGLEVPGADPLSTVAAAKFGPKSARRRGRPRKHPRDVWTEAHSMLDDLCGTSATPRGKGARQLPRLSPEERQRRADHMRRVSEARWASAHSDNPSVASPCTLRGIATAVAHRHDLTLSEMMARSRRGHLVRARQEAMFEMVSAGRWSLPRIGMFFDLDHTTILHGKRAHEKLLRAAKPNPHPQNEEARHGGMANGQAL